MVKLYVQQLLTPRHLVSTLKSHLSSFFKVGHQKNLDCI